MLERYRRFVTVMMSQYSDEALPKGDVDPTLREPIHSSKKVKKEMLVLLKSFYLLISLFFVQTRKFFRPSRRSLEDEEYDLDTSDVMQCTDKDQRPVGLTFHEDLKTRTPGKVKKEMPVLLKFFYLLISLFFGRTRKFFRPSRRSLEDEEDDLDTSDVMQCTDKDQRPVGLTFHEDPKTCSRVFFMRYGPGELYQRPTFFVISEIRDDYTPDSLSRRSRKPRTRRSSSKKTSSSAAPSTGGEESPYLSEPERDYVEIHIEDGMLVNREQRRTRIRTSIFCCFALCLFFIAAITTGVMFYLLP